MTPSDIADCRTDLLTFANTVFTARKGAPMVPNWHQRAICRALERVVLGRTTRLVINIPPRTGKTELAVINFMSWAIGNWPDSEFIHASYSKRLAAANSYTVRALLQSETYREVFPWVFLAGDSKARDEFRTVQGGVVYATGAQGTITGYGAGKMCPTFGGAIIIDDPHKPDEATSSTRRANVIDWFQNTIESRKNHPTTPIIVIMQRLHEADLSGWLMSGGNGEEWESLVIPALDDADESFWPEQFPTDRLHTLRDASPYVFAGQQMQRPAPLGGGIFKEDWWRYYITPPVLSYRMIYGDTAQKTAEQNDYSVFQCWGKSLDGQAVLLDQIRGKWEAPELLDHARQFWNTHKGRKSGLGALRAMKIEDKVSGTGLIQTLSREGVPVVGIPRERDKITRALDAAPLAQSGNVIIPQNAPWLSGWISEHSVFPNGTHDDQVDPSMDAMSDILGGGTYDYSKLN